MKKISFLLITCVLFAATSFAQQDSTAKSKKTSKKQHKTTQSDTPPSDNSAPKKEHKMTSRAKHIDSTPTMAQ
jgi:hypothetical protein